MPVRWQTWKRTALVAVALTLCAGASANDNEDAEFAAAASAAAAAAAGNGPADKSPEFSRESFDEGFASIDHAMYPGAPRPPAPALDPDATCEQMYAEIGNLLPETGTHRPNFYENSLNSVIGVLTAMWPPALMLYAVPVYSRYQEYQRSGSAKNRVRALRAQMAQKNCWVN